MDASVVAKVGINGKHLDELRGWFTSRQATLSWGGPEFRYPFTKTSFAKDAKLDELLSVCLLNNSNELLAFGQCYERLGCCHFARLGVAPEQRGKKLVRRLMTALVQEAQNKFKFNELSLFVLQANTAARRAYETIGFTYCDYPQQNPWSNIVYMRAPAEYLRTESG